MITRDDAVKLLEDLAGIFNDDIANKVIDIAQAISLEDIYIHGWGADDKLLETLYQDDDAPLTEEQINELNKLVFAPSEAEAPEDEEEEGEEEKVQ